MISRYTHIVVRIVLCGDTTRKLDRYMIKVVG
jgi:hypothetical protein